jgi:hypothetical protein
MPLVSLSLSLSLCITNKRGRGEIGKEEKGGNIGRRG